MSLPRVLEPEVMDSHTEAIEYDAMDHRAVNERFVRDFLSHWQGHSPILDIGTGTALIPIEFCRQSKEGNLIGIDLAEEMLIKARENVAQANLTHRVELQKMDAKAIPYPDGEFRAVMSNSIVHHIPDPTAALAELVRVTAIGGIIFVRDLLRPNTIDELNSLVDMYAHGATDHQRQLFSDSLHAALTLDEIRVLITGYGFSNMSVQATSDRHWTWSAIRES